MDNPAKQTGNIGYTRRRKTKQKLSCFYFPANNWR